MAEFSWEENWRYSGIPKVGDYIQIKGYTLVESFIVLEGFVVLVKGIRVELIPKPVNAYYATAWRRRIVPEREEELMEAEA